MISIRPVDPNETFRNPLNGIPEPGIGSKSLQLSTQAHVDLYDLRTCAFQVESLGTVPPSPFWFLNGSGAYFSQSGAISFSDISARDFDPEIDTDASQFLLCSEEDGVELPIGSTRFVRDIEHNPNLFTSSFLHEKDGAPSILTIDALPNLESQLEQDVRNGLSTVAWERHCTFTSLLAYASRFYQGMYQGFAVPNNGSFQEFNKATNLALFYAMSEEITEKDSVYIITSRALNIFLSRLLPQSHISFGKLRTYGIQANENGSVQLVSDQVSICRILGSEILASRDRIKQNLVNPLDETNSKLSSAEQAIHDSVIALSHTLSPFPEVAVGDMLLSNVLLQTAERAIQDLTSLKDRVAKVRQNMKV